jgi:outer membrane biosynthesis protein TonB
MPQSSLPPSSKLVPRHSHSGAVYVLAVIVLVCAIGAIICWKLKPEPVARTTAPAATGQQRSPAFTEPPPPPPPPEEDAGPVVAKAPTAAAASGPCSGPCRGTASAALQAAVSGRAAASRPCYERALRVNSALQGKLLVSVRVDPSGIVCSAGIAQDGVRSSEVSTCVLGMFRNSRFPAPTGGCVDINVPMSFMPKEGK